MWREKPRGHGKVVERKPKAPMNPYICYMNANVVLIRDYANKYIYPNDGITRTKHQIYVESMTQCGKNWKAMSSQEQEPYHSLAQEEYYRFVNEMKEFKETGFYTNKDGVNTRDMPPLVKYTNLPWGRKKKVDEESRYFKQKRLGLKVKCKPDMIKSSFMFFMDKNTANLMA